MIGIFKSLALALALCTTLDARPPRVTVHLDPPPLPRIVIGGMGHPGHRAESWRPHGRRDWRYERFLEMERRRHRHHRHPGFGFQDPHPEQGWGYGGRR